MKRLSFTMLIAASLLAALPAPCRAWVAAGGYRGGVAVGYHPPCCYHGYGYSGAAVAGAAVAGAMVGAAAASAAQPVYYAPPVAYAPAVGTVVASLPPGCTSLSISGISYMNCSGIFYMPFYSGGALMYQVTNPGS